MITNEELFRFFGIIAGAIGLFPLGYVIKLQWEETKIQDELIFMRWGIFIGEIMYFLLNIVFITVSSLMVLDLYRDGIAGYLSFMARSSNLLISIILYLIYTKDYQVPKKGR